MTSSTSGSFQDHQLYGPGRLPDVLLATWARRGLARLLRPMMQLGCLTVILPDTTPFVLGDGSAAEAVTVRVRDWRTAARLALNPDLYLGEAYMDGGLVVERGTIWDLLDLIGRNLAARPQRRAGLYAKVKRRIEQANSRAAARRNVARHYDLSLELYRRFLDEDLQYSCAYFERRGMTLEEAQAAKKRHLADKLLLAPELRVLDIGCGWGGLALTLAEEADARVTGITLSQEQLAVAQSRPQARGLADRVAFRLEDYRDTEGRFDRIVSVGMFEHVGTPNYQDYFDAMAQLLTMTASPSSTPLATGMSPEPRRPGSANTSSPAAVYRGALRGAAGDRARRHVGHRHRNPAAALCRHPEGVARAFRGAPRRDRRPVR